MPSIVNGYPAKYLLYNQQNSKNLAIVMQVEGLDDLYGISQTFTLVRYGDAGLVYGLPGLVYGGLRNLSQVKPYIILDSSMSISQRIEPEQGKGSIGTLTMNLIDYNGDVSKIIAPGVVLDEIILKPEMKIWIGYAQTSFPDDFLLAYRGYCTQTNALPGKVAFQISDSSVKKRQPTFDVGQTLNTTDLDVVTTTIPVVSTSGFYQQILGPDGTYDPLVGTYIRIEDEIMEYGPTDLTDSTVTVVRGSLGSLATTHDLGQDVTNTIEIGKGVQGINCIELMLKIMLSGWNGPCETNVPILSFVYTYVDALGFINNAFVLKNEDAIQTYGLSVGDYFYISGSAIPGNNTTGRITGFADGQVANQIIYTDQSFTLDNPSLATVSFRSQFDTLPISSGLQMRMRDVDVAQYLFLKKNYFNAAATSNMQFYIDQVQDGKDFIDSQICLPIGCYSITRFGRSSIAITKPPLPTAGKLIQLDYTNVLDPDKIQVSRSANSRSFYNMIQFQYDKDPVTGNYGAVQYYLDTVSLNNFSQTSILPITADGLKSHIGGAEISKNRSQALLNRYKKCTIMIEMTVTWSVGSLIEVSDIVIVNDNGQLQIMNYETGERNLGIQLFEVINRSYNISAGNVKLQLMGGLGFSVDSRFGLISPSSQTGNGCTSTEIKLVPSYGQTAIQDEINKWAMFSGLPVIVHNSDWSVSGSSFITGIGTSSPDALSLSPPLGFTPPSGYIVDINKYPMTTVKTDDALYKLLYAHYSPTIPVATGYSHTQFVVPSSGADLMTVGNTLFVRSPDYSVYSPEVKVTDISGTLITVGDLGFTPPTGYFVEGVGFKDGQSFYRYG